MQKRRFVGILITLLVVFNLNTSFAFLETLIQGSSTSIQNSINVGQWFVIPPGAIEVTEEVLVGLLTGDPAYPADGEYVLTGDIDLSGTTETFEPIDNFTGTFSGNGFTIGGFEIDVTNVEDQSEIGMFLNVGADASISDVYVSNVTVMQDDNNTDANANETTYVGVIVGNNQGTLSNIQVVGASINAENNVNGFLGSGNMTLYAGGLVGRNDGIIINSYAQVNVTLNSSVSSSWFSSSVGNVYVGGLVGYNAGSISQSYASGNVTSNIDTSTSGWGASVTVNSYTGGLVGYNVSGGVVSEVFATGDLVLNTDTNSGNRYMGAVVGRNQGTTTSLYRLDTATITANRTPTINTANTTATTITNLQSATFLTQYLSFDFVNIWQEVANNYPILKDA